MLDWRFQSWIAALAKPKSNTEQIEIIGAKWVQLRRIKPVFVWPSFPLENYRPNYHAYNRYIKKINNHTGGVPKTGD